MSFTKLTAFTKDVSDLADDVQGNPADLKAYFDAAPEELRTYFNNLIDALKSTASGDSGAKNTGATAITGLTGTDVQSLLESLKNYIDTKATGAFYGDSNGSQSYATGWQVLRLQTIREMNTSLFSTRDANRVNILKSGLYAIDLNMTRSDLPAGQTWTIGFNVNDDGTKNYTNTMIMGDAAWYKTQGGPNASRIPFNYNTMIRFNANDYIYFYEQSDDGPRNYWYNYRVMRISD